MLFANILFQILHKMTSMVGSRPTIKVTPEDYEKEYNAQKERRKSNAAPKNSEHNQHDNSSRSKSRERSGSNTSISTGRVSIIVNEIFDLFYLRFALCCLYSNSFNDPDRVHDFR